jgi:hypothetical protein
MTELYHYTCEHGHAALGAAGEVMPTAMHTPAAVKRVDDAWRALLGISWFTDLDYPYRAALGLTSKTGICDRTVYRYRVLDAAGVAPWLGSAWRAQWPELRALELQEGSMPRHWYIATVPVAVELVPRDGQPT